MIADILPVIVGIAGAVWFGWHGVKGVRDGVVRIPVKWSVTGRIVGGYREFDREFDPMAYFATIALNILIFLFFLWVAIGRIA